MRKHESFINHIVPLIRQKYQKIIEKDKTELKFDDAFLNELSERMNEIDNVPNQIFESACLNYNISNDEGFKKLCDLGEESALFKFYKTNYANCSPSLVVKLKYFQSSVVYTNLFLGAPG